MCASRRGAPLWEREPSREEAYRRPRGGSQGRARMLRGATYLGTRTRNQRLRFNLRRARSPAGLFLTPARRRRRRRPTATIRNFAVFESSPPIVTGDTAVQADRGKNRSNFPSPIGPRLDGRQAGSAAGSEKRAVSSVTSRRRFRRLGRERERERVGTVTRGGERTAFGRFVSPSLGGGQFALSISPRLYF